MYQIDLGHVSIEPNQPVVAGSYTTIVLTYTAGHPIDDSGYVKIAFRSVSDFGAPQFEEVTAPNYCTVSTTGDCHIQPRWDPKGHTRPWDRALFLKIGRGYLNRGEKISVVFGDTSGGSPGWQMQSYCVRRFEFRTLVDPIATYQFKEVPNSPGLRIVPGEPARAVCIAPSQVKLGQGFTYYLKLEDRWGNPTSLPQALSHPGWRSPGIYTVEAADEMTSLAARSNPIDVTEKELPWNSFWADFHGQTEETVGSNTIDDYFTFARDYGLLDIAAHQGNDFQITDEFWERINQTTRAFYKPGSFVTFPGFEWSGNTPLGGDRNVFFASEGGQITRSSTELVPDSHQKNENSPTAKALFENLAKQDEPQPFVFAHVGGRYSDISTHDSALELAVEVHSAWGTFEWLVEEALERGYRVGICANSDGHKCRPGASYPGASTFGSLGGLTCVLARDLSREAVFEALSARRFYATSGNRCLVDVRLTMGDAREAIMGDILELNNRTPYLHGRLVGTAPIESIEVRNGRQIVELLRPYDRDDLGRRIKIVWRGAQVRGRDRKVRWDGGLQVQGNEIMEAVPINFWNANQPLQEVSDRQLTWTSVTTGGTSGIILKLKDSDLGTLQIETLQRTVECEIASIGLEPMVWECGGLQKEIRIYRLPDQQTSNAFSFDLPLKQLHERDNPIYVCMAQEDGHMAWTSPIYLVR